MKRKAFAQIPLMIGLLLMAIAIPVATKLVQQSQENRGKAAGDECGGTTGLTCHSGLICRQGFCVVSTVATATSKPATTAPVSTTAPVTGLSCGSKSGQRCVATTSCVALGDSNGSGTCPTGQKCCKAVNPPTATAAPTGCGATNEPCCVNSTCTGSALTCVSGKCVLKTPTAAPTASGLSCSSLGGHCTNGSSTGSMTCGDLENAVKTSDCGSFVVSGVTQQGVCCVLKPVQPCSSNGCSTKGVTESCSYPVSGYGIPVGTIYNGTHTCGLNSVKNCLNWTECKAPLSTGCSWWGNQMTVGQTKCFNSLGNIVGSDKVTCKSDGSMTSEHYNGQNCVTVLPTAKCCCGMNQATNTAVCNWYSTINCTDLSSLMYEGTCSGPAPTMSSTATLEPTSTTCGVTTNKPNGCICSSNSDCKSGYCDGFSRLCKVVPTLIPTLKPTIVPTAIPTTISTLRCYCNGNCGTGDCVQSSAATGLFTRICSSNYCIGAPTVAPTAIPTTAPILGPGTTGNSSVEPTTAPVCDSTKYKGSKNGTIWLHFDDAYTAGCICGGVAGTGYHYVCASKYWACGSGPKSTSDCAACVEACPNSSQKDLLQSCTPPDIDGTSKDTLCNVVGKAASCGGKTYCCPSIGGAWTTDMTSCPNVCKNAVGKVFSLNDFSIWRSEYIEGSYGTINRSTWQSDFDCDGKVTLNDYSIWRQNYINAINGVTL